MKKTSLSQIGADMLWYILLRLPLKTLFRCKTVCRAWLCIISDPKFCAAYRRWQQPLGLTHAGFFHSYSDPSGRSFVLFVPGGNCINDGITKEISSVFDPRNYPYPGCTEVRVLASANGVLLCRVRLLVPSSSSNYDQKLGSVYYVCNPFTREWRALPPYQTTLPAAIGFVCQEGEGSSYSYEVVRIVETNVVERYSSNSCQWSSKSCSSDREWSLMRDYPAVVVEGVYYWVCDQALVVAYDPVSNHLEDNVRLPDESVGRLLEWAQISIGVDDRKNLICYLFDQKGIEMWVRGNEDGRNAGQCVWWRKHHVELLPLQQMILDCTAEWLYYPDLQVKLFPGDPNKILLDWFDVAFSYEWESGNFQVLFDWAGEGYLAGRHYFPYYIPSWHFKL